MHPDIDAIYELVKGRIDVNSLIPTSIEVAREIEQLSNLKGSQKLELLQQILTRVVHESDKTPEEKSEILVFVNTVIPFVVQAAILASKSPIAAQVQATCVTCWKKWAT